MLHNDQTVILLLADATNFPIYSDLISHFEMRKSLFLEGKAAMEKIMMFDKRE